jgi:hypothetical protein
MAGFGSIAATGQSIVRYLNHCFDLEQPLDSERTTARLLRTEQFDRSAQVDGISGHTLSVFLYRIDFNKAMRAAWSGAGSVDGRAHLALDLHYLLTAWSDNAEYEHRILGRTLQCLEETPILAGPLLDPAGGWAAHEALQLMMEEVPTEALMRTFDSLPGDYRLSVPYIARVLRLDTTTARPDAPVQTVVNGMRPQVPR